jgi:hypothetical protein
VLPKRMSQRNEYVCSHENIYKIFIAVSFRIAQNQK